LVGTGPELGGVGTGVQLGRLERAYAWFFYGFFRLDFTGRGPERAGVVALGLMGVCLVQALALGDAILWRYAGRSVLLRLPPPLAAAVCLGAMAVHGVAVLRGQRWKLYVNAGARRAAPWVALEAASAVALLVGLSAGFLLTIASGRS
jgi:hypothetical protein